MGRAAVTASGPVKTSAVQSLVYMQREAQVIRGGALVINSARAVQVYLRRCLADCRHRRPYLFQKLVGEHLPLVRDCLPRRSVLPTKERRTEGGRQRVLDRE